jgi:nucleotide-binding universal stress UspA family protein
MLVNLSLIVLRNKRPELYRPYKSPFALNIKIKGKGWVIPILPMLGFFVCLFVWILVLNLHQIGKIVGTLWFIVGILMYLGYRRSQKIHWRNHIPGTTVTHPDVAHELHPEIAEELKSKYDSAKAVQKETQKGKPVYSNILVPLSRPQTIDNMVEVACDLLEEGGRVHLVTVMEVPPQLPTQASVLNGKSMALLLSAVENARSHGVDATAEAISARSAADAIIQSAMSKECDLIVMGSSQRTMTEKMLFGNIVDHVLKNAPCDVVVLSYTNDLNPINYHKILVPTSGYLHATHALEIAINLEKKFNGSITSLYVGKDRETASANAILGRVNEMAIGSGVSHSAIFLTGNVVDSIINIAKDGAYDLIIIGATERPRQYKQLLGSNADEIVKRAPCNVLIVRTKKTQPDK